MILKNKLTKEKLELNNPEFKKRFAKEISEALESYKKSVLAKPSYRIYSDFEMEGDFYFDLQWNFNNHSNSNWYIEKN